MVIGLADVLHRAHNMKSLCPISLRWCALTEQLKIYYKLSLVKTLSQEKLSSAWRLPCRRIINLFIMNSLFSFYYFFFIFNNDFTFIWFHSIHINNMLGLVCGAYHIDDDADGGDHHYRCALSRRTYILTYCYVNTKKATKKNRKYFTYCPALLSLSLCTITVLCTFLLRTDGTNKIN